MNETSDPQKLQGPLILLFADDHGNANLKEQIEVLRGTFGDLQKETDVLVVLSERVEDLEGETLSGLTAAKLRHDFQVWPDEFLFILINDEGEVQRKEAFVVDPETLTTMLNRILQ